MTESNFWSNKLRGWLKTQSESSLSTLSEKTGLQVSCLTDLLEGRDTVPNRMKIVLAPHVCAEEELAQVYEETGSVRSHDKQGFQPKIRHSSDRIIKDKIDLYVLGMTARIKGTSFAEVRERFGSEGVHRLDRYIKIELAQKTVDDRYEIADQHVYYPEFCEIFERIEISAKSLTTESAENMVYCHYVAGVNEEGLRKANAATRVFEVEIQRIAKENAGDIVVTAFAASGELK